MLMKRRGLHISLELALVESLDLPYGVHYSASGEDRLDRTESLVKNYGSVAAATVILHLTNR